MVMVMVLVTVCEGVVMLALAQLYRLEIVHCKKPL